jgi:hypothetical protein
MTAVMGQMVCNNGRKIGRPRLAISLFAFPPQGACDFNIIVLLWRGCIGGRDMEASAVSVRLHHVGPQGAKPKTALAWQVFWRTSKWDRLNAAFFRRKKVIGFAQIHAEKTLHLYHADIPRLLRAGAVTHPSRQHGTGIWQVRRNRPRREYRHRDAVPEHD